jgi:transketolase
MSARGQFVSTMTALLDEDPRCALVLADISLDRFAPAVAAHGGRVVNVGIREQAMIGVTAGLCLAGMRAVAHSYATFLVERPFEQIKLDLSHQAFEAVLVSIAGSYDASEEGRTHQSPGDVALLDTLPAWTVHVPGHPGEVDGLLRSAVSSSGNIYIRLSDSSNSVPARSGASIVREGSDGSPLVIAVGPLLDPVIEATSDLDVTVCHLTTIRPFPDDLVALVGATDIVLVEPYLAGTSASQVARALVDRPHRLFCLGVSNPELHRFGSPDDHARAHGLDAAGIRRSLASYL